MRLAVLASGSGTNLQALIDTVHGRDGVDIAAVASDQPDAYALERAAAAGIATRVFPRADFPDRGARDSALAGWLTAQQVELVVLAGYMQLLGAGFLAAFPHRVINVHPALLPAFPGLHAVQQAIDYGVRVFGVTVHLVDGGVDTGPVILQQAIALPPGIDADAALGLLRPLEHELLPEAVRLFAAGAVRIDPSSPRRVSLER